MDHMKARFGGSIKSRRGRDIHIGCSKGSNHGHRHDFQCLTFAARPSLDTMVGTDGNQAGTMFHTTLDIYLL